MERKKEKRKEKKAKRKEKERVELATLLEGAGLSFSKFSSAILKTLISGGNLL